jgi:hypothetical protein
MLQYRCSFPFFFLFVQRKNMLSEEYHPLHKPEKGVGLHYRRFRGLARPQVLEIARCKKVKSGVGRVESAKSG